ncbi:MAG: hypothetical protein QOD77_2158 [Thermoplasmata archaeon]|jgi:hypothetical protein|nr:hypothetical protein [Thermoplasmata archaeon]
MTVTLESVPKDVKAIPPEAQALWVAAYNKDFGWRCSEAHAATAAWRVVQAVHPGLGPKE